MKFKLITGPAHTSECAGCGDTFVSGTEGYYSAATGRLVMPGEGYWHPGNPCLAYCAECAAKLSKPDPSRSVSRFYTDTSGTHIIFEANVGE